MATASTVRLGHRATLMLQRADAAEYRWCLRINRLSHFAGWRQLFRIVSRLGDGVFWYSLMLLWPLLYAEKGLALSLRMAVVGVIGLLLYKYLKKHLVRERPYITLAGVVAGMPPLDRYSFPSGHTLHAVSCTILICSTYPVMMWWCLPFAAMVAASRVVLGLHYPSDVLVGAGIGASLAIGCLKWWPPIT
jgi:undecaprenyl-diphosphatase